MRKIIYLVLVLALIGIKTNAPFADQQDDISNLIIKIDNLKQKGQIAEAIDLCEKHLSSGKFSENDEYKITLELVILYSNLGKYQKAINILTNIIEKYPKNEKDVNALYILASIWLQVGEKEKAIDYYNLILAKYPNSKVASIVKSDLETMEDVLTLLEKGTRRIEFVRTLPPLKGYSFIIFEVFKPAMFRFIIIFSVIFILYRIASLFKLPRKKEGKTILLRKKDLLFILAMSIFTPPLLIFIYLFQFGQGGHFLLYDKYIELIALKPKEYCLIMILSITFALLVTFLYLRYNKFSFRYLFFNKLKIYKNILLSILLCPVVFFLLQLLCYVIDRFSLAPSIKSYPDFVTPVSLISLTYMIILAPFFEEVFFRGILFSTFERESNFYFAAFLSALSFSLFYLFHIDFNIIIFIYLFIFGILFSFLFKKLGLFCCILCHSVYLLLLLIFTAHI